MIINELFNTDIKPNTNSQVADSIEKVAEYIKFNCSEFLHERRPGKFLYRGALGDYSYDIQIVNPRINRSPSGLDRIVHDNLIKCFRLMGLEATRNKTLSCTSSRDNAEEFSYGGEIFLVFPLNGFTYTWSTKFYDIGILGQSDLSPEEKEMMNFIASIPKAEITKEVAKTVINQWGFTNNNLALAMKKQHEVAIAGKCLLINSNNEGDLSSLLD